MSYKKDNISTKKNTKKDEVSSDALVHKKMKHYLQMLNNIILKE